MLLLPPWMRLCCCRSVRSLRVLRSFRVLRVMKMFKYLDSLKMIAAVRTAAC